MQKKRSKQSYFSYKEKKFIELSNIDEKGDIDAIHKRMVFLGNFFEKNAKYKGFLAFLKTYEKVTKTVLDKSLNPNYFENPEKIKNLDVIFAKLYFTPLKELFEKNKYATPWKESFNIMKNNKQLPFVQMLMGINSHINGDLPVALLRTKYSERKDFLKINKILENEIPGLMQFLAFHENDLIALGAMIFQGFVLEEFHKTVIKWRIDAWKNYLILKQNPKKIKELRDKTEEMNLKLLDLFSKLERFENLNSFLKEINRLKVKI